MAFFGLLLCIMAAYLMYRKVSFVIRGNVVQGEVVGLQEGARGLYGMRGYHYRIRIEYEGNIYIATSLETIVTASGYPAREARGYYKVYFNPAKPKQVSIKGKSAIIWWSLVAFVIGVIMLFI